MQWQTCTCTRYYGRCILLAHRCKEAGCGSVLVLDGNMKNSRDVCAAEHAGFVEYCGLPGRVTTGCMETPEQRSKYCSQHKPRQSVRHCIDDERKSQGGVIEMIIAKKSTRTNIFDQVILLCIKFGSTTFILACIYFLTIGPMAWIRGMQSNMGKSRRFAF